MEVLLVHNKFAYNEGLTYISKGIRMVTCSKWNHVAIRIGDIVIEAKANGITEMEYDVWLEYANRIVLPMKPKVQVYPEKVKLLIGEKYGYGDIYERLKEIKAERWDGRDDYVYKDHNGYVCSDVACIFLGLEEMLIPADLVHHYALEKGKEYITVKRKK